MDKIAEMLTKIRNAQLAGHQEVAIDASKLKVSIAKILEKEGFVESVKLESGDHFDKIRIGLKYNPVSNTKKTPAIRGIRKISKQGQRIYLKSKDIKSVKNNYGIAIISTSKGVMTGNQSRKLGLGGEYICEIW